MIAIKRTMLKVCIALLMMLSANNIYAQTDLGVVWKFTYSNPNGYRNAKLEWITNQADGTYTASGSIFRIADNRRLGYIIHFDESGSKKKHFILSPPQQKEWNGNWWADEAPGARIRYAYIVGNEVLTFGTIMPQAGTFSQIPIDIRAAYTYGAASPGFKNGHWVTKFNYDTEAVSVNRLDRGIGASSSEIGIGPQNNIHYNNNTIISIDYNDQNPLGNAFSLLRMYDHNLNILTESYNDQWWPVRLEYTEVANEFELIGRDGVFRYRINNSGGTYTLSNLGKVFASLASTEACLGANNAGNIAPSMRKKTGGYWVGTRLDMYKGTSGGWAIYKKRSNNTEVVCQVNGNVTSNNRKDYYPPSLLPGSSNQYVGNLLDYSAFPALKNRMYLMVDDINNAVMGNFTITDGVELPYFTNIMGVSKTDGVFAGGFNDLTGGNIEAALVKFSTCVNFKINNLPIDNKIIVDHAIAAINIPLDYEGAKAPSSTGVKYDLQAYVEEGTVTYNGVTVTPSINGGLLENLTSQDVIDYVAGKGKALDLNRSYTFAEGPVVIKYILSIKDSYTTAGVPQSCGQTYIFRLVSLPQVEVVAMPNIIQEGGMTKVNTSIKNVGIAPFANPFNITIYQDAVGDATKHTYTYSKAIACNETVNFEIDLPASLSGAGKLVIQINDDGTGGGQTESNAGLHTYEIDL